MLAAGYVLAANALGCALYSELYRDPTRPVNTARFLFLNPRAPEFYGEWERSATDVVATLRAEAARNPYDKALTDLVGELSTRSEFFRTRWATHDVRLHRTGTKHFRPPCGVHAPSFRATEPRQDRDQQGRGPRLGTETDLRNVGCRRH